MDSVARSFKQDTDAVHKVITSKCPLVMGVGVDHIQVVYPEYNVKEKIEKPVECLKMLEDIQTLLVYVSGHYKPEEGGFELKLNSDYLSIRELQSHIANIFCREQSAGESYSTANRAIVFLDCCSAPPVTVSPVKEVSLTNRKNQNPLNEAQSGDENAAPANQVDAELILRVTGIRIVQINACRPGQSAIQEPGGSVFRQFLRQGLTSALDEPCKNSPDSQNCCIDGDFVTAGNLLTYVSKHIAMYKASNQCDCVMNIHNADHKDVTIGYAVNFKVDLEFTYRLNGKVERDKIPQRMFSELLELQILLFDRFIEKMKLKQPKQDEPELSNADFREILCIEVEKGPKKHQRDRLTSLERIMAAWTAKRDLEVTLRTLPEICDGMVGVFLPSNQTVEAILDFLRKRNSDSVKVAEADYATCIVKSGDDFGDITVEEEIRQQKPSLETFNNHLIELENAIYKNESDTTHFKELHIVFPCACVDGTRKHRSDFLCYQLKKETDIS